MNTEEALNALKKDPRFRPLIRKYGTPDLKRGAPAFQALVRSIIYQQVTGRAAASILTRFVALFDSKGKKFPTPKEIVAMSLGDMRTAGLSGQKASYIKDLAEKFTDGTIQHKKLDTMTSEEVIEHLVQVKGVGVWTAHMFLIFTLNRSDILPTGDLGVRKGFQVVYNLRTLPDHAKMEKLAKPWRASASYASWYLWRVADDAKLTKPKKKINI